MKLNSAFLFLLCTLGAASCSSSGDSDDVSFQAGAGGSLNQAGTGGGSGSGGNGNGGTAASGGTTGGTAGTSGAAGSNAGSGGTAGQGGDGGVGGEAPDAGGPEFTKQWSCPDGALPEAMAGEQITVCENFDLEFGYKEGPTWIASQNAFFFSNFAQGNGLTGNIIKYTFMGDCELWLEDAGTNGLAVHANGNLIGASHLTRSITEYDVNTKQATIIADMFMGETFDSPNDLVAHSNGTIYFTNPDYENSGREPGFGRAVFRIDPDGVVHLIQQIGGQPNGIALSPDESKLYVVGATAWNLDENGVPTTETTGGAGGDGISVDCAGNVRGIDTNSAFGGPDGTWLFIVGGGPPRMVHYNIPGLP